MMKQRHEDVVFNIFLVTIVLFTTLPQYIYVIEGVNVVNLTALIFLILYVVIGRHITILRVDKVVLGIAIYYFVYLFQCLFTVGIVKFLSYSLSFILMPYIAISLINSEKKFFKVIDVLIIGGVIWGCYGIFESILGLNVLQTFITDGTEVFHEVRYGLLRIMGSFGQPIGYGLYQVFVIALINYRFNTKKANKTKLCIAYFICALNVILSVSRIPIITLVLLQVILLLKKSKRELMKYILGVIVLLTLFVAYVVVMDIDIPFINDLFMTFQLFFTSSNIETTTTVGVGNRLDLWSWVNESMGQSWVLGHGLSAQFEYEFNSWGTKTSIENQYLNTLYYNGIIGLIALLISYVSTLYYAYKKNKKYGIASNEKCLNFNSVIIILCALYFIAELGVQESDMTRTYVMFLALLISYNRIRCREMKLTM